MTRRKIGVLSGLIVSLMVFVLATRGPSAPRPNPPGTFSFAVLGDAPYYIWEDMQYAIVLKELDANDLSLVLHVGIFSGGPVRTNSTNEVSIGTTSYAIRWFTHPATARLACRGGLVTRR